MEEIVLELLETIKWLTPSDKQSNWYEEYIDKVAEDLKKENKKES